MRAAAAHGEQEKRIGEADSNWPDWYADYTVREQSGVELPEWCWLLTSVVSMVGGGPRLARPGRHRAGAPEPCVYVAR